MKTIKVYDVKKLIEGMDFDGRKYITHLEVFLMR